MAEPTFESCPHHTPNAGGTVASELHGVCIFCWRDWWGAERTKRKELERVVKNLLSVFDSDAWKGTAIYASVHGWTVDPKVSMRHGDWIQEARDLRPEK